MTLYEGQVRRHVAVLNATDVLAPERLVSCVEFWSHRVEVHFAHSKRPPRTPGVSAVEGWTLVDDQGTLLMPTGTSGGGHRDGIYHGTLVFEPASSGVKFLTLTTPAGFEIVVPAHW
jgi:hypothetical protein